MWSVAMSAAMIVFGLGIFFYSIYKIRHGKKVLKLSLVFYLLCAVAGISMLVRSYVGFELGYLAIAIFCTLAFCYCRSVGLFFMGGGVWMNGLAMAANDFLMPVSAEAALMAGITPSSDFWNFSGRYQWMTDETRLWWFGDFILIGIPELDRVYIASIGDIVLFVGAILMMYELVIKRCGFAHTSL